MSIIKSLPILKSFRGNTIKCSEQVTISDPIYETGCESFLVIKNIEHCKVKLSSFHSEHITIKAMTTVLIIPDNGKIDEDFDEIELHSGSAIELIYAFDTWYIVSSDGIKMH
jgi:hypothetical protein